MTADGPSPGAVDITDDPQAYPDVAEGRVTVLVGGGVPPFRLTREQCVELAEEVFWSLNELKLHQSVKPARYVSVDDPDAGRRVVTSDPDLAP